VAGRKREMPKIGLSVWRWTRKGVKPIQTTSSIGRRRPSFEILEERWVLDAALPNIFPGLALHLGNVGPASVVIGDLNEDGNPDLVTANSLADTISVFLGEGDGRFTSAQYAVGDLPIDVEMADFDGDGHMDLVVSNAGDNSLSLLFGTSEGTFGEEVRWSLASSSRNLAVGDFDGDGHPDIAAILVGDDGTSVTVFTSQGDGSFDLLFESPAGISPDALTAADVNGDGRLDLIVGNFGSIDVYLSKEDGTFESVSTATPIRTDSLAVADFDGDGLLDVAVCERGSPYLIVGLGRGDGGFDLLPTETFDGPVQCVLTGDFNEDMTMDLVLVVGDGTILSLTGRGDGSLEAHIPSGPSAAWGSAAGSVGDINRDGHLDVITVSDRDISVVFGNGTGAFPSRQSYPAGHIPSRVRQADLDNDGWPDLLVANWLGGDVSIFLNDRTGNFVEKGRYPIGSYMGAVAAADFNEDGHADFAAVDRANGQVAVFLGIGGGQFSPGSRLAVGQGPSDVVAADFNGDGHLDLAVCNQGSNDVSVLLGQGDGAFQTQARFAVGSNPFSLAASDFNGDGRMDLISANWDSADVSILLGNGDGTFQTELRYTMGDGSRSVAVGDFNGDGFVDVATGNRQDHSISVRLGNGDGTFGPESRYSVGIFVSHLTVADFDGDGHLDVATTNSDSNDVAILFGNGDGTFLSNLRFSAGESPEALAAVDVDRNGRIDLVVLNQLADTITVLRNLLPDRYSVHDVGIVDDLTISDLSAPELTGTVFQVTRARNGFLTVIAESVDIPGSITLRLFDENPFENPEATLLAQSESTGSQNRLDYEFADEGNSYYVMVSRTDTDFSLRFVNLFAVEVQGEAGALASVFGTDGDDFLVLRPGTSPEVVINGVAYALAQTPDGLTVQGDLGSGQDIVVAYDAVEDDVFYLRPGILKGAISAPIPTSVDAVVGFEEAHVYATGGGQDTAWLYDSSEDGLVDLSVRLKSEPQYRHVKMIGPGMYHRVKLFEVVHGFSTGDNDRAVLFDSSGDDVFSGGYGLSRISGPGYDVTVHNFRSVTAFASQGHDTAALVDSVFKDELHAKAHKHEIFDQVTAGVGYRVTVRAFDYVYAEASTAGDNRDTVKVWPTGWDDLVVISGDVLDHFVVSGAEARRLFRAAGFEFAKLQPTTDSNDRVQLTEPIEISLDISSGWQGT